MKKYLCAMILAALAATSANATNYTLTASTAGPRSPSIIFSSNPVTGINCGSTSTACAKAFLAGTTVTLTAVSASTTVFAGWEGEATCGTNAPTCAILMNTNRTISARFNPVLSVSLFGNGGGTVTDASGTINCGITSGGCSNGYAITQSYYPGTQVNLTAVSDGTSTFTGWTGAGCSTSNPCVFSMTTSQVVIATFTSVGPFTIGVSTAGTGKGRITSSPAGINCSSTNTVCTAGFVRNVSITLTATAFTGYSFAGWANAGCSGTGTCVLLSTSAWQGTSGWFPTAYFY